MADKSGRDGRRIIAKRKGKVIWLDHLLTIMIEVLTLS